MKFVCTVNIYTSNTVIPSIFSFYLLFCEEKLINYHGYDENKFPCFSPQGLPLTSHKISESFELPCEIRCTVIGSKKSQYLSLVAPPSRRLSLFPKHKATRIIKTLPWIYKILVHRKVPPCISSGFPNNSPVPIYTPGWREAWGE